MFRNFISQLKEMQDFLLLWGSQSLSSLGSAMTGYALLIWVYQQKHSATSVALLAVYTYLPPVVFGLFAGAFADRHDKKKIMLFTDSAAAIGTVLLFLLMSAGKLQVLHIYGINMLNSVMNAFQKPANTVAVSAIVPKKRYRMIGGLQSISSSIVGILTPAFATALMAFAGIYVIFVIDLATFLVAFLSLLCLIHIPPTLGSSENTAKSPYLRDCREGFRFLKNHSALLQFILLFTAVNLVAYIGGGGITTTVTAMILSRIPDGQPVLGAFSAAVGFGTLTGGLIVTFLKPRASRKAGASAVIFVSCGVSFFLCDLSLGLSQSPVIWIVFNFLGSLPLAFLSANSSVIMRNAVPIEMQGRVFSARDTLQYCTIPLGYLLGGVFADSVFEPLMRGDSLVKHIFTPIVGSGSGSGIALMFICTGISGTVISFIGVFNKKIRTLDQYHS